MVRFPIGLLNDVNVQRAWHRGEGQFADGESHLPWRAHWGAVKRVHVRPASFLPL